MNHKLTAVFAASAMTIISCLAQDQPGPGPGGPARPPLDLSKLPPPSDRTDLTFTNDIEPIFKASCVNCHSGQRARGNLRLDALESALKGGQHGQDIKPGDSMHSPLVIAVARLDPRSAMPPMRRPRPGGPGGPPPAMGGPGAPGGPDAGTNAPPTNAPPEGGGPGPGMPPPGGGYGGRRGPPPKPLTPDEVGLIRAWIDAGAK
jgi:hypothetical protein